MAATKAVLICLALLGLASCALARDAEQAPRYIVNLDESALTRWNHVIADYVDSFGPVLQFINSLIPPSLQQMLEPLFESIDNYLPGEYPDELRGVANASQALTLGKVVAMNLIYDFTAFCTSIVAQQPNGTILHARNLDYNIPGMRNLTIQVAFQRGGVTQYECTTFAGYVGCLTGMRVGGWSVTVDQRDPSNETIVDNIIAALLGGKSLTMFLRTSLDTINDFETAVDTLATVPLIAPVYLIMAGVGPGEGAVITRNQSAAIDVWRIDADAGRWWILETNYDHWLPPPPDDDRRDPANKAMAAIGQENISIDGMFGVLSAPPVLNSGTRYTAQMIPALGFSNAYIRYDAPSDYEFMFGKTKPLQ